MLGARNERRQTFSGGGEAPGVLVKSILTSLEGGNLRPDEVIAYPEARGGAEDQGKEFHSWR